MYVISKIKLIHSVSVSQETKKNLFQSLHIRIDVKQLSTLTDKGGFPQVTSAFQRHLQEFGVLIHQVILPLQ